MSKKIPSTISDLDFKSKCRLLQLVEDGAQYTTLRAYFNLNRTEVNWVQDNRPIFQKHVQKLRKEKLKYLDEARKKSNALNETARLHGSWRKPPSKTSKGRIWKVNKSKEEELLNLSFERNIGWLADKYSVTEDQMNKEIKRLRAKK